MKRFATKAVAVVLAVVFVMSFAACSGGKKAEAGTLKVGVLAPLTGSVAEYGNAVNNGIVQFVEELNAKGGVNGKQIELVPYDEEGDPVKAVTGYNYLMDQEVVAIIGDVTTAPTPASSTPSRATRWPPSPWSS